MNTRFVQNMKFSVIKPGWTHQQRFTECDYLRLISLFSHHFEWLTN